MKLPIILIGDLREWDAATHDMADGLPLYCEGEGCGRKIVADGDMAVMAKRDADRDGSELWTLCEPCAGKIIQSGIAAGESVTCTTHPEHIEKGLEFLNRNRQHAIRRN